MSTVNVVLKGIIQQQYDLLLGELAIFLVTVLYIKGGQDFSSVQCLSEICKIIQAYITQ